MNNKKKQTRKNNRFILQSGGNYGVLTLQKLTKRGYPQLLIVGIPEKQFATRFDLQRDAELYLQNAGVDVTDEWQIISVK